MTDKYEEFKEWIDSIAPHSCIRQLYILFEEFEKEHREKKREKEIKEVLDKYIVEIKIGDFLGEETIINLSKSVEKCYNELKEKDMIK